MNYKIYKKLNYFYFTCLIIVFCMVLISAKYIAETIGFSNITKAYFYSYYPIVLYVLLLLVLLTYIILFYLDLKKKVFNNVKRRSLFLFLLIIFLIMIWFYRK